MIVRITSVFCDAIEDDGEPCPQWVAETNDGAVMARRIARRKGWVNRGGRDLCPKHQGGPA